MIRYALSCDHDHGFEAWFGSSSDYDDQAAREVRAHVEANFDYVGDAFAREARDIHEGRSEKREIYGEATPAEVKKLKDDGVPVSALPDAPPDPSKVN